MAEHTPFKRRVESSNLSYLTITAPLAQLVEQLTLNQWVLGSSPRWCTKKSRNECCGFFVAPFPPGRTHTSRKRSCSSRGDWSLNSVRRTEFLTRPLMVHQKKPQRMLRLFCCTIPFGTDSHFAQALVFVSRGLVAKNGCGFVSRGHD